MSAKIRDPRLYTFETSCAAGAPLRMTTANGGQKILVAKSKMMLILSLNSLDPKRENGLRHQYHGAYCLLPIQ
jgi:hypothetical protein